MQEENERAIRTLKVLRIILMLIIFLYTIFYIEQSKPKPLPVIPEMPVSGGYKLPVPDICQDGKCDLGKG